MRDNGGCSKPYRWGASGSTAGGDEVAGGGCKAEVAGGVDSGGVGVATSVTIVAAGWVAPGCDGGLALAMMGGRTIGGQWDATAGSMFQRRYLLVST